MLLLSLTNHQEIHQSSAHSDSFINSYCRESALFAIKSAIAFLLTSP